MAQIINNPDVPNITPIDNGLSPGKMVRIQGTAAPAAQRININLQCGPNVSPRDDIALHLSIRVAEGSVGRNTLDKQMWGEEQTQGFNPIGAGQQFEVIVLCDQMNYKIAINGRHFCEFPHRIPFNRVSHLTIDGDLTVKLISFENGGPPPSSAPHMTEGAPAGPMPPYGGQQMYGPPGGPPAGYGPPPMGPPQYGGPGPYGPGPYGPPPPPGHHPDGDKSGSGLEGFLGQAGAAIAGAFGSAVLQGALSGKQNQQAPNQPHPPQQQQPQQSQNPLAGGYGGQSVGGLGSIGSFLTSTLANTVLKPQNKYTKKDKKAARKAEKEARKAAKKALKYGVPAAGIGFGTYALHKKVKHQKKHHKHGYRRHSSSSSSSSSSSDSN